MTTLRKDNLYKKVKRNNNNNNRRTQNGQRQNKYKNSKDRSRSWSTSQKGTNNKGTAKQDAKNDKDKEYFTPAESRNQDSNKKNMHYFGKFNNFLNWQQQKKTFDVIVIEPIRNEET